MVDEWVRQKCSKTYGEDSAIRPIFLLGDTVPGRLETPRTSVQAGAHYLLVTRLQEMLPDALHFACPRTAHRVVVRQRVRLQIHNH